MANNSRFCTNCGAPVAAGTRFCGQCGHPVQTLPPTPPPPAPNQPPRRTGPAPAAPPAPVQAQREPILGIVAVGKQKGMLAMRLDFYSMIVTPSRLVFAYVSPQLQKTAVKQAREQAKAQGKGFFGQWGAQLAWLGVLHEQYRRMAMEAILAQYPGSFALQRHQIQKVRYRDHYDQDSGNTTREIILRTVDGKLKLKLLSGTIREVKQLLRQALGGVA